MYPLKSSLKLKKTSSFLGSFDTIKDILQKKKSFTPVENFCKISSTSSGQNHKDNIHDIENNICYDNNDINVDTNNNNYNNSNNDDDNNNNDKNNNNDNNNKNNNVHESSPWYIFNKNKLKKYKDKIKNRKSQKNNINTIDNNIETTLYDESKHVFGTLVVDVIDSGVGMASEETKRLFKEIIQFNPSELQVNLILNKGESY